jgi:hypothetical protein
MSFVRTKLSAAGILVAVLLTTGAPLLAAEAVCLTKHHDCGKTPRLAEPCCGDIGDVSNLPGVAQARTDVTRDHSAVSILPYAIETPRSGARAWHVDISPPRGRSPDLSILFADLRL